MKFEWKPMLIVYLFAALFVAVFLLSVQFNLPFIFRPPQVQQESNLDAYNKDSLVDGAVSTVALEMYLEVLPPSINQSERVFKLSPYEDLIAYVRDDSDTLDVEHICIDSIYAYIPSDEENTYFEFIQEPVCHSMDENDWFGDYAYRLDDEQEYMLTNHWYVTLPHQSMRSLSIDSPWVISSNFWFPYDSFALNIYIQAQTTITLSDGTEKTEIVPMYYYWKLQSTGSRPWDSTLTSSVQQLSESDESNPLYEEGLSAGYFQQTDVTFQRVSLYLIAFPFLITAMIILISFVPLMINSDIESILGVQTGLLFAIFALRSILSPGGELGQTLVEVSVIGLSVLQIFSAGVLLFRINRKRQQEKSENT